MATWALCLCLILSMVAPKKASSEEEMIRWACGHTPHVEACLSHLLSTNVEAIQLNSLAQVRKEMVRMAREGVSRAMSWASSMDIDDSGGQLCDRIALRDCVELYEDSEHRLRHLLGRGKDPDDARAWLSAALTSHRTCLDGLRGANSSLLVRRGGENITVSLSNALALYALSTNESDRSTWKWRPDENEGLLASWNGSVQAADFVVAKDGSGNYKTINEAVAALAQRRHRRPPRVVVYVKSGVYAENVGIGGGMKNVMFVGDGIDRTVITGNRSVRDGFTTLRSATFGVSGDGFWARDMTFENTAGPAKHQAVALRVGSDLSAFYRCSFRGYQDTLLVQSLRQFYRDCHIYGTIDFIFGNAAAVFQNCDIYVRRPMDHQSNMITAQGRDGPHENTGISIHGCRVAPSPEFQAVKNSFKTYLGRPWKQYSRTVFMRTDLDGLINPEGWTEWTGSFALSTLYYGEFMNSGAGALTSNRVKWPGFHVFNNPRDVNPFTVSRFIQGESWIPVTGVPFFPGV
ncbi:plant invertase/pectin methylesterase inhibitor superfamily [Tasmannia lanceolata]|uniref:plant invertase/pectin methylesterase inhibitor superfamily n=1 Tax=Tasmannia lanceolata TaxID=3420 RepID=UPI0040636D65